MKASAHRFVVLAFALLVLVLEVALSLYWTALLEPRLRREAEQQALLLAQAQAGEIADALDAATAAARAARIGETVDRLLLRRDPVRDEPFLLDLELILDEGIAELPDDLVVDAPSSGGFPVSVELYHPQTMALVGVAGMRVNDGFYRAFAADVRLQLVGQGIAIALLLLVTGGALAWVLRALERQQLARAAAEQALAANERRLQRLIDRLDHYYTYTRAPDGELVSVSDSVQRVLGIAPEAVVAQGRELLTEHPVNASSLARLDDRGGRDTDQVEFELRTPDGSLHRIECSEVVVRDAHGRVTGIEGIARDVSLQHRVHEQLAAARDAAEQASLAKSRFLANMSHEIRTPMNAIIGMSTLLSRARLAPREHDRVRQVQASARLLLALIDDILDLSRIEAGRLDVSPGRFSLDELLTDLTALVGERARDKGLDVLIHRDLALPAALEGDALRLQQVLVNLVVNAIKFTDSGEVVVQVVQLDHRADATSLRFLVRDTGQGIDPDALPRLFDPFTQVDPSSTRRHGGAGLGLAISSRLVELMGAKLEARSTPGEGSEFWFDLRLPLASDPLPPPRLAREGLGVLVVDDNPAALEIFGDMLGSLGFRVRLCADAEQAMALIESGEAFDLLLIDHRLPGMSGLEAVRELRRRGRCPPALMVTAHGDEALAAEAERAGVEAFLPKPVSPSALFDAALKALGSHPGSPAARRGPGAAREPLAAGRRILLVEDNAINREVAGELLRDLGAAVVHAGNGAEALEQLARTPVDLVLMDVQMPVLDGLEATRRLRRVPGLERLPVVALTAHAMSTDRERCLEAGMDDYLAKPIDDRELERVLAHWLDQASPLSDVQASGAPAPSATLDLAGALARMNHKRELLLRLLADFVRRYADAATVLRDQLHRGEHTAARDQAHGIKGAAATLGLVAVAEAARGIEHAIDAGHEPGDALDQIETALAAAASSDFAAMLGAASAARTETVPADLSARAGAIAEGLAEHRLDAVRDAIDLLDGLPPALRDGADVRRLRESLECLDLAQARHRLESLRARLAEAAP